MKVNESSPPGFKGTTKAMKKHPEIDNAFALSWWMKNNKIKNKVKYESFLEYANRRENSGS